MIKHECTLRLLVVMACDRRLITVILRLVLARYGSIAPVLPQDCNLDLFILLIYRVRLLGEDEHAWLVIIDNREYVSTDATSTSGMATDLKYFVDWMKLPSSLLYVKLYGDYRDDGNGLTESQLPQQTRKWIQAIGGDVEFSNNWNAGTGGYRRLGGTFASGSFYEGLNNTVMYVASPGPAILSATNGQPMYCGAGSGGSVTNFSNCMSAYFRAEDLGPGACRSFHPRRCQFSMGHGLDATR